MAERSGFPGKHLRIAEHAEKTNAWKATTRKSPQSPSEFIPTEATVISSSMK